MEPKQRSNSSNSSRRRPLPRQEVSPLSLDMSETSSCTGGSNSKVGRAAYKAAKRVHSEMAMHSNVVDPSRVEAVPKVDNVIVGELLGQGKFCRVHKADVNNNSTSISSNNKRYAVKFLRNDLAPDQYCKGAAELVLEMNLLSSLKHPHIISLEGVSKDGPKGFLLQQQQQHQHYFLVFPRLQETLKERMGVWRELEGRCNSLEMQKGLFLKRLTVAHDLASALSYLHSQKVIYRDLNLNNAAFNHKGQIQLLDFGLARELEDAKLSKDGVHYDLGGNKGELQYMAPEVALSHPYHLSADVYSMTILTWQLCGLQMQPFFGLSTKQHYIQRVIKEKERPKMDPTWSDTLQYTLRMGWSDDADSRPPMKQLHRSLLAELQDVQDQFGIMSSSSSSQQQHQPAPIQSITANNNDSELVSPLSLRSSYLPPTTTTRSYQQQQHHHQQPRFPPALPFDKDDILNTPSPTTTKPDRFEPMARKQPPSPMRREQPGILPRRPAAATTATVATGGGGNRSTSPQRNARSNSPKRRPPSETRSSHSLRGRTSRREPSTRSGVVSKSPTRYPLPQVKSLARSPQAPPTPTKTTKVKSSRSERSERSSASSNRSPMNRRQQQLQQQCQSPRTSFEENGFHPKASPDYSTNGSTGLEKFTERSSRTSRGRHERSRNHDRSERTSMDGPQRTNMDRSELYSMDRSERTHMDRSSRSSHKQHHRRQRQQQQQQQQRSSSRQKKHEELYNSRSGSAEFAIRVDPNKGQATKRAIAERRAQQQQRREQQEDQSSLRRLLRQDETVLKSPIARRPSLAALENALGREDDDNNINAENDDDDVKESYTVYGEEDPFQPPPMSPSQVANMLTSGILSPESNSMPSMLQSSISSSSDLGGRSWPEDKGFQSRTSAFRPASSPQRNHGAYPALA